MSSLRDLPDLELAALLHALHEGMLFCTTLAPAVTEYMGLAVRATGREVLARRDVGKSPVRIFPAQRLAFDEFQAVQELVRHIGDRLRECGFTAAADLVNERLPEIQPDFSVPRGCENTERRMH